MTKLGRFPILPAFIAMAFKYFFRIQALPTSSLTISMHIYLLISRKVVEHTHRYCLESGFPQKSQKKVPWLFHEFSMPKSKFPDTKYQHKLREYTFLWLIYQFIASITNIRIDINSYPLFASMDTGIYPSAALQYPAWPKAKCGIAMLRIHGSKEGVTN